HTDFLLRHAVLAPSSHSTQPWMFEVHGDRFDVYADMSRWLEVADADQRELRLSLGCALENLLLAAESVGFAPLLRLFPDPTCPELVARVRLHPRPPGMQPSRPVELVDAIPDRRTERDPFDGCPVPRSVQDDLSALATEPGVEVHLTDHPTLRRRMEELTLEADQRQFADPAWRRELAHWIGEGVFGTNWLASKIGALAVRYFDLVRTVGEKDLDALESAPLVGMITTDRTDPEAQVRAGQLFERVFLAATQAGLVLHPMNQILQVPEIRRDFVDLIPGAWGTPQIIFRLGYAEEDEEKDPSPRRPLDDVVRRGAG
ncbi:MAG TPA: hypothetical protein VLA43_07645, partial [Longimicrobiales bacterium]|nr:hypothetical protein [Longimicrobiales bacterium]